MASTPTTTADDSADHALPVRRIDAGDVRASLSEGWADFMDKRGDLIIIGVLYPVIGMVAAVVSLGGPLLPLLFPMAAGFTLMGPLAAVGFYELARRREQGLESDWSHFFDVRKRPGFEGIQVVALLLIVIFLGWLGSAAILYAVLFGAPPATIGGFFAEVFGTPQGWALILVGNLVGLGFATAVLAVSIASLPMLVDRDVEASQAVATSIAAARANPAIVARWGVIVAALLVVGSIPLFIGLAVVLPWLGYATWHLYTRMVERPAALARAAGDR